MDPEKDTIRWNPVTTLKQLTEKQTVVTATAVQLFACEFCHDEGIKALKFLVVTSASCIKFLRFSMIHLQRSGKYKTYTDLVRNDLGFHDCQNVLFNTIQQRM